MLKMILFPSLLAIGIATAPPKSTQWVGTVQNGTESDKISFLVSADGKSLSGLTYAGCLPCLGQTGHQEVGPKNAFKIENGKVQGVAVDTPTGDTWRFELEGSFSSATAASGTFRMNTTDESCDTRRLEWAAAPLR